MTTDEKPEIISLCFGQIQLYVPRSRADIARARKLLDLLEAQIEESEIVEMTRQREESELKDLQIEAKPISAGEREDLGVKTSTLSENPPERNLSVPAPMFSKPSARAQAPARKNKKN